MQLVIGNKNYSSWSMRPWLMLDAFDVDFDEVQVSLAEPGLSERLREYSDSCRVPVLIDGETHIWDSLAICETVSERFLEGNGWPQIIDDRATARAITAEMHAGFAALRNEMPMNCRARRTVQLTSAAIADIQRIDEIWSRYAREDGLGNVRLFGQFSIADCFFAPVAMRFITYGIELSSAAQAYLDSMRVHSSVAKWLESALQEAEIIKEDEAGVER